MRKGFSRGLSIAAAVIGAFFVLIAAVSSWTWSQVMDTDDYVETMMVVIEQPIVQNEIADTIVTAVVGESPIPGEVTNLLTEGARVAVASPGFASFWELANRSLHESLRRQILSDDPIESIVARIDMTAEVGAVLERVRAIDPRLAEVLPDQAPETAIEIADTERLREIRGAVSGLDRLAGTTPWVAAAFLAMAALLRGFSRRSLRVPAIALALVAPATYGIGYLVPWTVRRFVDDRFHEPADAVSTHIGSALAGRAWQLLFIAAAIFLVTVIPASVFKRGTKDL